MVVQGRNHTAVGRVEGAEDIQIRSKAAAGVEVDIAKADMLEDREAGSPEDMSAAEVDHIVRQGACKKAEARSESQLAASCPVLHCSFPVSERVHDAETANA